MSAAGTRGLLEIGVVLFATTEAVAGGCVLTPDALQVVDHVMHNHHPSDIDGIIATFRARVPAARGVAPLSVLRSVTMLGAISLLEVPADLFMIDHMLQVVCDLGPDTWRLAA